MLLGRAQDHFFPGLERRAACSVGKRDSELPQGDRRKGSLVLMPLRGSCFGELQTSAEKLFTFFPSFSVFDAAFYMNFIKSQIFFKIVLLIPGE